jgi:hypothetical protein
MLRRNSHSNLFSWVYITGALLAAAACADSPPREGQGEAATACEGDCSAETTPGEGSTEAQRSQGPTPGEGSTEAQRSQGPTPGESSTEAQRSQGPTTCVAPQGAACVYDSLGSGCSSPANCVWSSCTGLPQLCDDLTIYSDGTIEGDPACVLAALRDGNEGMVRWRVEQNFFSAYNQTIFILGGRRAMRQVIEFQDISGDADRDGPSPLRDAAFFESCLAQPSPAALKACLTDAALGCGLSEPN